MNILFVITGLGLGGAERQLCLLADRFAEEMHNVTIVALSGNAVITPARKDIKIYCLDMKKTIISFLSSLFKLRNIISDTKPDVVHSHMFHANIMTRMVRLISGCNFNLICTAHSKNEGGRFRMLAYRVTDHLCDINTNVSQEALEKFIELKSFSSSKSFVNYNGIDTDVFNFSSEVRNILRKKLCIEDEEIMILSVGRLTPAKDYPNLLDAFNLLPKHYKLVIIGEGEVRTVLEKKIKDYNLASRVKLLGSINEVQDYYSACDLFVLSSAWEGFGLVVAEAMACQRIAVSTDAGGVKEVIGNNDFIVPVSNPKALANKIIEIEGLTEERKCILQTNNRNHIINNFSIDSVVSKWLSMYRMKQDT